MSHKPETLALHAGWRADPATGAVAVPIYQTTSYQFQSAEHAANLFALKELGNIYTRIMNPTNDVLEKRVAALEGGVAALALASGQAASAFAVQNLAKAGDNVVSSTDLYGGTWNLFANTMKDQGIEVRFVDPDDPENFRQGDRRPHPRLLRRDAAQPEADRLPDRGSGGDRPPARHSAHHGQHRRADPDAARSITARRSSSIPRPNISAATGTSIGGLLVDSGTFPWEEHKGRQPALNTPDPSYHGAVWSEAVKPLGPIAYIIKARVTLLRDLGSAMSPFNAFLTLQGIETLPLAHGAPLRQCGGGRGMAWQAPGSHQGHPSVASDGRGAAARREISQGRAGRPRRLRDQGRQGRRAQVHRRAEALLSRRQYRRRALARHPSRDDDPLAALGREEQLATGVSESYVRLSVGIEHIDDILADLDQALKAAA